MADNYTILSQHQSVQLNPAGTTFEDVWDVTYKVTSGPAKGTVATVTVPSEEHTADVVQQMIESKISDLESVATLGSGGSA
jgi:hypothetical protein